MLPVVLLSPVGTELLQPYDHREKTRKEKGEEKNRK